MEKTIPEIEAKLKSSQTEKEKKDQAFSAFKEEREAQEKRISEAELKDQAITTQQKSLTELKKVQARIQKDIKKLGREVAETRKNISRINNEIDACNRYLKENEKDADLETNRRKLDASFKQETEILKQLEDKWTLEIMVVKYEEDRRKLKHGEPCPLCGSPEHPWAAAGMVPEPEGTEAVLKEKKKQVDNIQKEVADISVKIAETNSSLKHLEKEKKELAEKQTGLSNDWNGYIQKLSVELSYKDQKELKDLSKTAARELDEYERLIKQVRELKSFIEKLNDQISGIEKKRAELNLGHSKIEGEKRQAESDIQRIQKDLESVKSDIQNLLSVCADQFNYFGASVPDPGAEDTLLKELEKRNKAFKDTQGRRETLEKQLGPLREKMSGLESRINSQKEKEGENQEQCSTVEKMITGLQTERKALIGDDNPQKLKLKLKARHSEYESTLKKLVLRLINPAHNFGNIKYN